MLLGILRKKRISIRVFSAGRLGNQLFQLAAALTLLDKVQASSTNQHPLKIYWHGPTTEIEKLSKLLGVSIESKQNKFIERLINNSIPLSNRRFHIRIIFSIWWRFQKLGKTILSTAEEILSFDVSSSRQIIVTGYFHEFRLSQSLISRYEASGSFNELMPDSLQVQLQYLKDKFIGVHLRYGDYLLPANKNNLGELGSRYYENAIQLLNKLENSTRILVFSDDPSEARLKLSNLQTLKLEFAGDYCANFFEEFMLFTLLSKKVISNSTFSWWAGYLSPKTSVVIAPEPLSLEQVDGGAKSPGFTYLKAAYN